jgi:hypothetical protein
LVAHVIGEQLKQVPKATHRGGPKKQSPARGKSLGRGPRSMEQGKDRALAGKMFKLEHFHC